MIEKEDYDNGLRCRGICKCCIETSLCYQYEKDIKGTKYDFIKKENKKMKISDLRKGIKEVPVSILKLGDWFICSNNYLDLFRVSDYEINDGYSIPCIDAKTGEYIPFDEDELVTPVEVEINIIS